MNMQKWVKPWTVDQSVDEIEKHASRVFHTLTGTSLLLCLMGMGLQLLFPPGLHDKTFFLWNPALPISSALAPMSLVAAVLLMVMAVAVVVGSDRYVLQKKREERGVENPLLSQLLSSRVRRAKESLLSEAEAIDAHPPALIHCAPVKKRVHIEREMIKGAKARPWAMGQGVSQEPVGSV